MNTDKNEEHTTPSGDSDFLDVRIEKLVTGGDGLARHEGRAVFCPLTAPGDRVRVKPVEQRKGFVRAELDSVLEPGPGRTEPPCPHYGDCGGCDLQHLDVAAQRAARTAIVGDCFRRLGKMDVDDRIGDAGAGEPWGYRNRIRLHAHPAGPYGLRRRGSHEVVPIDACPLMLGQFNEQVLPWLRMLPPVDQIVVRLDGQGGWLLSLFGQQARLKPLKRMLASAPAGEAPAPGCVGILFNNRPVWGRDHLVIPVAGHTYRVAAQGFFQANRPTTEQAIGLVRAWLDGLGYADRPGPLLGDLYCGVGLFTLALADRFERIVAIELDEGACRDAQNNVRRDAGAAEKTSVHVGPVAQVLGQVDVVAAETWRDAVVMLDPPRTGLDKDGVAAVAARGPAHIAYLSCDPATLARDVAGLVAAGYRLERVDVLDMFPQTSHVESLALLSADRDGAG